MRPRPITRAEIWAAIRKLGAAQDATFGVADVARASRASNKSARDYLTALTAAGFLRMANEGDGPARWAIQRNPGHEAPRLRADGAAVTHGTVTEQLWRGMCMLRRFDYRDLIETASVEIAEETARDYCKHLLAAGYLRVVAKASPSAGRIARYQLVRDTGPHPPQIRRVKQVYDPNLQAVFGLEAGS